MPRVRTRYTGTVPLCSTFSKVNDRDNVRKKQNVCLLSSNGSVLGVNDEFDNKGSFHGGSVDTNLESCFYQELKLKHTNERTYPETTPTITVLCDSRSVIDRISSMQRQTTRSGDTIRDDYDVYNQVYQTIVQLKHIVFQFVHVKGTRTARNTDIFRYRRA